MNLLNSRPGVSYHNPLGEWDRKYLQLQNTNTLLRFNSSVTDRALDDVTNVQLPFLLRISTTKSFGEVLYVKKWVYLHPSLRRNKSMRYINHLRNKSGTPQDFNYVSFFSAIFKL